MTLRWLLAIALCATACSPTEHRATDTSEPSSKSITIEGRLSDGTRCYTLRGPTNEVLAPEHCPVLLASSFDEDFIFGESAGRSGDLRWVVYWINDAVEIVDATKPFDRSEIGWTVFEVGPSGVASFRARKGAAEYRCEAASAIECVVES